MQNPTHLLYSLGLDEFFFDPYEFDDPSDLIQQGISHAQEGRMDEAHNSFLTAFDLCVTMESTDVPTGLNVWRSMPAECFQQMLLQQCMGNAGVTRTVHEWDHTTDSTHLLDVCESS